MDSETKRFLKKYAQLRDWDYNELKLKYLSARKEVQVLLLKWFYEDVEEINKLVERNLI